MFGPAFLVAPMYSDSQSREVVLPPGRWYDFHDPAQVYQGDTVIVVTPEPGRIPVFAAGNSIHVTGNIYRGNAVRWYEDTTRSLFVHVRPGDRGDSCAFTYVDYLADDEHSRIRCKKDSAGVVTVHLPAMVTRGVLSLQPVDAPSRVEQDATHIDRWSFDEKTHRVSIPFAPQGQTVYRVYTER
jgi:alpha-glucosidase (family GH31 glycosyl hydrolase)